MPVFALAPAAATAFWGAVGAGATAGAGIYGAKKSSSSTDKAAQLQTDALNRSADLQAQAAKDALAYQQEKDRQDQELFKAAQLGSYQQYAAREGRLAPYRGYGQSATETLGAMLGLTPAQIAPPPPPPAQLMPGGTLGGMAGLTPQQAAAAANASDPQSPAAAGGNYQAWFNSLIQGKPFNQQTLLDLEPTLNKYGVQLTPPNAVGDRTKIGLPNGQWVRVGFGEGQPVWVPQGPTMATQPAARQALPLSAFLAPMTALPFKTQAPSPTLSLADYFG